MELIAKFYAHQWSTDLIDQAFLTSKVSIHQKLKDFWTAEFLMPIAPNIKEWCKVELYEVNSNQDRLKFRGFVYELNPVWWQFQTLKITAREEKALFHKRKALQDYKFEDRLLSQIISELVQIYNSSYNEDWWFDIQFDESLTLEVGQGDDYFDLFDELAEQKKSYRTVEDGVICFRRHWNNLSETQIVEFDGYSPNPWNITGIEVVGTDTWGNVIIVEDTENKKTVDTSKFDGVLTGVVSKQIRKWDDQEKAESLSKDLSKPQRKYQITVANGSIFADIGDKIKVEVVNTNSFFDYSWDAIILSKSSIYENGDKIIQYEISDTLAQPFSSSAWVQGVEKSIRLLRQKGKSSKKMIRYIRDIIVGGSTANGYAHWNEIQAFSNSKNVAQGKVVQLTEGTSGGDLKRITNWNLSDYIGVGGSIASITVDLGQVMEVDYLKIWHYHADDRIYHGTKTLVSEDGENRFTVFDSAISGEYKETATWRITHL